MIGECLKRVNLAKTYLEEGKIALEIVKCLKINKMPFSKVSFSKGFAKAEEKVLLTFAQLFSTARHLGGTLQCCSRNTDFLASERITMWVDFASSAAKSPPFPSGSYRRLWARLISTRPFFSPIDRTVKSDDPEAKGI